MFKPTDAGPLASPGVLPYTPSVSRPYNKLFVDSNGDWLAEPFSTVSPQAPLDINLQPHFHGGVMSTPFFEQLATAQRAGLEALFGLSTKAFGSVQELAELNLRVISATFAKNQDLLAKAYSAKDPQALLALPASMVVQPAAEEAVSYGRQLAEVLSKVQVEFSAVASAVAQQYQHDTEALLENFKKNVPTGTDSVVAAWKSAISSASASSEAAMKSAKQTAVTEVSSK
jgi:phasin family protein